MMSDETKFKQRALREALENIRQATSEATLGAIQELLPNLTVEERITIVQLIAGAAVGEARWIFADIM